jgi:hypothetical protein
MAGHPLRLRRRQPSRRLKDLLPARRFRCTPNHAHEASQIRDVAELLFGRFVGRPQPFFAKGQDTGARSLRLPLLFPLFQNGQMRVGFVHDSHSSKNPRRRVTS